MTLESYRQIIIASYPELKYSDFTLHDKGWDCTAVEVDDRLVFKFPREGDLDQLRREASILNALKGKIKLRIPDLKLIEKAGLYSVHEKIKGSHLSTAEYETLTASGKRKLARDIAGFYVDIHAIDVNVMMEAGALPIDGWPSALTIERGIESLLSKVRFDRAKTILHQWNKMTPDPYSHVFGYFDGHGWNMAFDHSAQLLNGIYDFGDAGIGDLHEEFIYTNFISPSLTKEVIGYYEEMTGKPIDCGRVDNLFGTLLLVELAEMATDERHAEFVISNANRWLDMMADCTSSLP